MPLVGGNVVAVAGRAHRLFFFFLAPNNRRECLSIVGKPEWPRNRYFCGPVIWGMLINYQGLPKPI